MQIFALKGNVPEIPDVAPAVRERARAVRARLDTIRRQSPPPDDQLPAIMDEQLERIRAFGPRELHRLSLIDFLATELPPFLRDSSRHRI
jgi:hypothetical protein